MSQVAIGRGAGFEEVGEHWYLMVNSRIVALPLMGVRCRRVCVGLRNLDYCRLLKCHWYFGHIPIADGEGAVWYPPLSLPLKGVGRWAEAECFEFRLFFFVFN